MLADLSDIVNFFRQTSLTYVVLFFVMCYLKYLHFTLLCQQHLCDVFGQINLLLHIKFLTLVN